MSAAQLNQLSPSVKKESFRTIPIRRPDALAYKLRENNYKTKQGLTVT
jgi:hypothetical protein